MAAIDPVCKMSVDDKNPPGGISQYQGKTYYFCSAGCKRSFDREPAKYAQAGPQPAGGMTAGHH